MLPEKILKKIKEIELKADKLSSSIIIGKHLSTFKGTGIDFSDLREYKPGDDVRNISWRQSIRSNKTYIKRYTEERNLSILLLMDISPSGNFGSGEKFNSEAAAEFAATIAFSAKKSGDNIGIVFFTNNIELYIPPRKNPSHISRIIREILFFKPKSTITDLNLVLSKLGTFIPRHSHVFLLTDIWSNIELSTLKIFSKKHSLNVITFYDNLEKELKDIGNVELNDLETNNNVIINTSSKKLRKRYKEKMFTLFEKRKIFLNSIGARNIFINNKNNIFLEIIKFYSLKNKNAQ